MTDVYDTIICGAGPSGSVAGRTLAKNGHRVLIIDKDSFPRDKPCGGALATHIDKIEYIHRELPNYIDSTCKRGNVYSQDQKHMADTGILDVVFYNIRRKPFDNTLLQQARSEGAEFKVATVTEIDINLSGVDICLKSGETVRGRTVIGASGACDLLLQRIARENGFERWMNSMMGTVVVKEIEVNERALDLIYGSERTAIIQLKQSGLPSYSWIFPKKNVINIGYGSYTAKMKQINIKEEFIRMMDNFKSRGLLPLSVEFDGFRGAPLPLGRGYPVTYTDRGVVTGDAGGFVSALTGEGLFYAIDSGRIAGEVLSEKLRTNQLSRNHMKEYQDQWYEEWGRDLDILIKYMQWIMRFPNLAVRIANKDRELLSLFLQLYMGTVSAHAIRYRFLKLIGKNLLSP